MPIKGNLLNNVTLDTILKEELKKNKNAAKNLKKHWKEIQNIKDIDFGELFLSFQIQHIHRQFGGTDTSLLAIFAVFEFLHNLNTLIFDINAERRMKAINEAAGMEICTLKQNSFMIDHYKNLINRLKKGKIDARPEIWNYVISDNEKKEMEKQAAEEALNILKYPVNIIRFIENSIEGNYNFQ
jgi:hypothetical protein